MTEESRAYRQPEGEPDPRKDGSDDPLEPASQPAIRYRRLAPLAVVVVLLVLGIGVVQAVRYIVSAPAQPPAAQQSPPPVVQEPVRPTDLQQLKSAEGLGPFEHIAVSPNTPTPETRYPAVLLLSQDGSVHASQKWQVPFGANDPVWMSGNTLQQVKPMSNLIQELSVQNGFATFKANNRTYTIRCGQAFLFEQEPQTVVVIDAAGAQHFTITPRAQLVRKSL